MQTEATETRQLIRYETAMQLAGMPKRTFYRRLARGLVPIFTDPDDRRRRYLDRRDVMRLKTQETEPAREYDGSGA